MRILYDLKDKALEALDHYGEKRDLSGSDWDRVDDMVGIIKDIVTVCAMEEGGYSGDGEWEAQMRGNYGRGSSGANRRRDSMGRYSREERRGGYSMADGEIDRMLAEARTDRERDLIMRMAGRG